MNIQEINRLEEWVPIKEDWNRLLSRSENNNLFLTFEWLSTWWRHFGENSIFSGKKRLRILLLREGSDIVGIAPLMVRELRRFGVTIKALEFIGCGLGDYSDFILTKDKKRQLGMIWDYLIEHGGWSFGILDNLAGFSDNTSLVEHTLPSQRLRRLSYQGHLCPHVAIRGSWQTYLEEVFKKRAHGGRRKKELNRLERLLAGRGKVNYRLIRGHREDPRFIEHMAAVQRRSTKAENLFDLPGRRQFLEQFALETADKDWLRISALEVDGEWVAYYFGFHYANRYLLYNTSFIADFADCSPGTLLMIQLLKHAFEEGLEEVDFMRGEEGFKFNWANGSRRNMRLVFHRRTIPASFTHSLYFNLWPRFKSLIRPPMAGDRSPNRKKQAFLLPGSVP